MMTALFSAAASLRAHQSELDVLGNNIANISTPGYKGEQALFQELLVSTLQSASAPSGALGGINPIQVGQGANVGGVSRNFSNGSVQATGRPTDLALAGDGFFVVSDGKQQFYTRDGSLSLDANGQLVTSGGLTVMGWAGKGAGPGSALGALQVPVNEVLPAQATASVSLNGNLDSATATDGKATTTFSIYDSLGEAKQISVAFTHNADGSWTWNAAGPDGAAAGTGQLTFDASGKLAAGGTGTLAITLPGATPTTLSVQTDFSALSQVAGSSTASLKTQDGTTSGAYRALNIDSRGVLTASYTNGVEKELGRVALSRFVNPSGLTSLGSNLYAASANSGQPQPAGAGDDASLKLVSKALEMSNVDLSTELTQMIVAQRGFQANAKVITATDEVLQELLALKR
ncbi:MAG TPA: flagellar hook protein FlgE [Armatimonadota bacterium]|jgi:flagellar hook protein FlgE